MNTLADFKRRLKVGVKVHAYNHDLDKDFGVREISVVQSNAFAMATDTVTGLQNSWCDFPKAKDIEFPDADTAVIYWGLNERRSKILTYKFV